MTAVAGAIVAAVLAILGGIIAFFAGERKGGQEAAQRRAGALAQAQAEQTQSRRTAALERMGREQAETTRVLGGAGSEMAGADLAGLAAREAQGPESPRAKATDDAVRRELDAWQNDLSRLR